MLLRSAGDYMPSTALTSAVVGDPACDSYTRNLIHRLRRRLPSEWAIDTRQARKTRDARGRVSDAPRGYRLTLVLTDSALRDA